jgi:RNA polymerase sigma-70 factor (ECF subfamily)
VPESLRPSSPDPEELIARYQRRVYAVIHRMTGNHPEVDDLCQETFLQVIRSLPSLPPGGNLDAWVYRIAMNVSVDHLRRAGRDRRIVETLKAGPAPSDSPPAGRDEELVRVVQHAMEELPEEQRVVLVLRMFENLSHEEISQIVLAPVATVRWRLFSARQKLEEVLSPWMETEGRLA